MLNLNLWQGRNVKDSVKVITTAESQILIRVFYTSTQWKIANKNTNLEPFFKTWPDIMENSSNYLREHQIVKFNREASNATKNTKLARVKPARDRDRVGCFIPHPIFMNI